MSSQVDEDGENYEFNLSTRAYGYYKIVRDIWVTTDILNSGIEEETVVSGIWP